MLISYPPDDLLENITSAVCVRGGTSGPTEGTKDG